MRRPRILLSHLNPLLGAAVARRIAAAGWQPVAQSRSGEPAALAAGGTFTAAVVQVTSYSDIAVTLVERCLQGGIPCILVADRSKGMPIRLPRRLVEQAVTVVVIGTGSGALMRAATNVLQALRFCVAGGRVTVAGTHQTAPLSLLPREQEVVVAVGASTGGIDALREILGRLPATAPPLLLVQHMPPGFTTSLAQRLDEVSALSVREAGDGEAPRRGSALLAPAGRHLRLEREAGQWRVRYDDGAPVNRHRPSADVLMESVASVAGERSIGVLLTGMGEDGARGLLAMKQAGAETIAQDEATSVVYGMPRAAVRLGAARRVLALERIAQEILAAALERSWSVGL